MVRSNEVDEVAKRAKALAAAAKRYEAKRDKFGQSGLPSPKQAEKQAVDLATDAHRIEVLEADLHAACVNAGLSEPKGPEEYEERTWRMSSWHEYKWTPAKPKNLSKSK